MCGTVVKGEIIDPDLNNHAGGNFVWEIDPTKVGICLAEDYELQRCLDCGQTTGLHRNTGPHIGPFPWTQDPARVGTCLVDGWELQHCTACSAQTDERNIGVDPLNHKGPFCPDGCSDCDPTCPNACGECMACSVCTCPPKSIRIYADPAVTMHLNDTRDFDAIINEIYGDQTDDYKVVWKIENTKIATVDNMGIVKVNDYYIGTAVLIITLTGTDLRHSIILRIIP
jgi:hypothetical protein